MRNPLHAICPYFAMFPETFVEKQLLAHTRPGDLVFDPFCGRGTTILESLLRGRNVIGTDINPVAACIAGAKASLPTLEAVIERLNELETCCPDYVQLPFATDSFFRWCFADTTLRELLYLRQVLEWRSNSVDRFIAAVTLGILHGESHRTEMCLSNRMPRTISTKPDYSIKWWKERQSLPPIRHTFRIVRKMAEYRLSGETPAFNGEVRLADARSSGLELSKYRGLASFVLTSPPYLDTTDYAEDQWLRLWFLGGADRPIARLHKDDRHTQKSEYWSFIRDVWAGSESLLARRARIIIRIGGTKLSKTELFDGLMSSLRSGLSTRTVMPLHSGESSLIRRRQTNSFRPGTSPDKFEHDFAFEAIA